MCAHFTLCVHKGGGAHTQCVLQCIAMCSSVLQCVAVCCSVLQCVRKRLNNGEHTLCVVVCCSVLQRVAAGCSVLQCVAVCCRVCRKEKRMVSIHRDTEKYNVYYGVATISRLPQNISLFCKRALEKRLYSAKETYNFKEPTNRSHPINISDSYVLLVCVICQIRVWIISCSYILFVKYVFEL